MNREETAKLLMLVKSNYPYAYKDFDQLNDRMLINSWHVLFEDIPVEVMVKVAQKHFLTSEFPPTIKEFREAALKMTSKATRISGELAWDIAAKTVSKVGRYSKDVGMEKLRQAHPSIAKAVAAIGWETICNAPLEGGFVKRDFMNYYDEVDAPEREQNLIPEKMMRKIQELSIENVKKLGDLK